MREDYADWMEQRATYLDDDMVPDIDDVIRMAEEFQDVLNMKPGWYCVWHDATGKARMTQEPFDSESPAEIYAIAVGRDAFVVECK